MGRSIWWALTTFTAQTAEVGQQRPSWYGLDEVSGTAWKLGGGLGDLELPPNRISGAARRPLCGCRPVPELPPWTVLAGQGDLECWSLPTPLISISSTRTGPILRERCAVPQGLASIAYNVLTATLVYLDHQENLRWRPVCNQLG